MVLLQHSHDFLAENDIRAEEKKRWREKEKDVSGCIWSPQKKCVTHFHIYYIQTLMEAAECDLILSLLWRVH